MDLANAWSAIGWLSVLGAAVSAFVVGGVWYGPLFGRAWAQALGFSDDDLRARDPKKIFGLSLVLSFWAALIMEMFVGSAATLVTGAIAGSLAGVGWVAPFVVIIGLFESRPPRVMAINAGYCAVALTAMGAVCGAF